MCQNSVVENRNKRFHFWAALIGIATVFIVFRIPILLNPGFINSDGAITGLQARHMLQGEFQLLHWGRNYLTSIDSLVVAPFFALFGSTVQVLQVVTMLGQLVPVLLVFAITSRLLNIPKALLLSVPSIAVSMATNVYLHYCIRQWCIALVFLSVCV
jgi:hypothetical protein